jgi:hypothetical protein
MTGDWETLIDAGLPDGAIRQKPRPPLPVERIVQALVRVAADLNGMGPREREPLAAWLRAWQHHWPTQFRQLLGATGEQCLRQLQEGAPPDPNRYLKLRRIAVENLAGLL